MSLAIYIYVAVHGLWCVYGTVEVYDDDVYDVTVK